MNKFIFESYDFDSASGVASFRYGFEDGTRFHEEVKFRTGSKGYDEAVLEQALYLSFLLVGTSYYKLFPSSEVIIKTGSLDEWQRQFMEHVYQEGLSQFAFENMLTRRDLAHFSADMEGLATPLSRKDKSEGILALESGGKDSILTAALLRRHSKTFTSWYASSSSHHPQVLDGLGDGLRTVLRNIDTEGLKTARMTGGMNGHVPVTYILASFALVDAILNNEDTILLSIGHEGEEPHDWIGDLPVNHQWSKTWSAEQDLAEYVRRYISQDIKIGSPLRAYSELRIAELFIEYAWADYGHQFSSCNIANYMQGSDNTHLKWCGNCPKCANSFLLFAPFLEKDELASIFGGQDLFAKPTLQDTFKGLLGIDGVMKPFECVGETDELRLAYHMARKKGGYSEVSFAVPESSFDYKHHYDAQAWALQMIE